MRRRGSHCRGRLHVGRSPHRSGRAARSCIPASSAVRSSARTVVAVGVVERPLTRLLGVGEPSDRHARPLRTHQLTPRWSTLGNRESTRRVVDLDSHVVAKLRRRLVVRPLTHAVGVQLRNHVVIFASGTVRFERQQCLVGASNGLAAPAGRTNTITGPSEAVYCVTRPASSLRYPVRNGSAWRTGSSCQHDSGPIQVHGRFRREAMEPQRQGPRGRGSEHDSSPNREISRSTNRW